MNVKEEKICRVCLQVAENDFEPIDKIKRNMFNVLLLKVNLNVSKDPIICKDCTDILIKCFRFKLTCIDIEKLVFTSAAKTGVGFELKDVEIVDSFSCRFCSSRSNESNFVSLNTLKNDVTFVDKLQALMPEVDFDITSNPIICACCTHYLERYMKFAVNCWDVEQKIIKYRQDKGVLYSTQVKLSNILHNTSELNDTQVQTIKQEVTDTTHWRVNDNDLIKSEEIDIKDEQVSLNETPTDVYMHEINIPYRATQSSRYTPTVFKCATCTFETKHKKNLKSHTLTHKSIMKTKMYKCSICTFETKYNSSLRSHKVTHEDISKSEMYKCALCTYETKRKICLKKHMSIHKHTTEVEMYKCSICTHETRDKSCLKKHMLIHKEVPEAEMYKCSTCPYKTKHKRAFKRHTLIHKNITEVEMYKCSMCTHETRHKNCLKKHMLIHKEVPEAEMYKCLICIYETKDKRNLKRHMLTHKSITEVEIYKCSMCTLETRHKISLKKHMLMHKKYCQRDGKV